MELKQGYKQTEVGVIPVEWEDRTVGQLIEDGIIEKPLDGNHGNIHPKSGDFVQYGIPFVMANNVQNGTVDLVNCSFIRREQADLLQKGFSKSGDILLTHKATIGNTAIVGEIPFDYIMLTPQVTYYRVANKSRISNFYLRHFFDSTGFQNVLKVLAGGGTRSYIGINAQHQLPVVLPPLPEQRAIAEALSDVDGLLGGLERLIAKKRDLKQAAIQQLLTGQTRLPGFHGEWEVKTLGEVLTVRHGKSQHGIAASDGRFPILASGGEIGRTNAFLHDKASVLIGRKGTIDSPQYVDSPFWTVDTLFFTEIKGNAHAKFVFYKFTMISWRSYNEASGVPSLNARTIENIEVLLPPLPEQTAIAAVLSDMDAELAALEERREKTRLLKQGMMQELLTGRTRLV
jgi:type I restriction enzyme S subunit